MKDVAEIHQEYLENPTESYFFNKPVDYVLVNSLTQLILDIDSIAVDAVNVLDAREDVYSQPIYCGVCGELALLSEKVTPDSDDLADVPLCLGCGEGLQLGPGKRRIIAGQILYHNEKISEAMREIGGMGWSGRAPEF